MRRIVLAGTRWLRSSSGGTPASSLSASAPRLRIVPDVPMTRSKPRPAMSSRYAPSGLVDVLHEPTLVVIRQRVAAHEALGEADDTELEALRLREVRGRAERDLDAAAADVDDDGLRAADVDAVSRREVDESRLFGARR